VVSIDLSKCQTPQGAKEVIIEAYNGYFPPKPWYSLIYSDLRKCSSPKVTYAAACFTFSIVLGDTSWHHREVLFKAALQRLAEEKDGTQPVWLVFHDLSKLISSTVNDPTQISKAEVSSVLRGLIMNMAKAGAVTIATGSVATIYEDLETGDCTQSSLLCCLFQNHTDACVSRSSHRNQDEPVHHRPGGG
jgi:hypothetical protein